jgi:hypothetical protein
MSAGLAQAELTQSTAVDTPLPTAWPSTAGERFRASWNAAQTEDTYFNQRGAWIDHGNQIIKDLQATTGQRLPNPFDMQPTQEEIRANLGQPIPVIMAKRLEALKTATSQARETYKDFLGQMPDEFLNVDAIPRLIAESSNAARERAAALEGTGNGLAGAAGGMAGAMVTPHNILGLPLLGATAVPRMAAAATIGTWAANILKEGAFQALTQTALQVPGTILDYTARKEVGTEPSVKEMMTELATVAAGGFVLGAGARTITATLTKLRLAGVELPPAVRDAATAMEGDALYDNKNPLGIPAAKFEQMQDQGMESVLQAKMPTHEPMQIQTNPENRIDPSLKSEVDKVEKLSQEVPPVKPAPTPEPQGAGRPQVEGLTPEQTEMIAAAKKQAETVEGGASFLKDMELLEADERGLAALAKHCGIPL